MRLKEIIIQEKNVMERLFSRYNEAEQDLPGIKFYPRKNGNKIKYYILEPDAEREKHLSWTKHERLIRRLLERKNAKEKKRLAEENITTLEYFLKFYHFQDEMIPLDGCEEIPLRGKQHLPKSQNPYHREELIHDTGLGFFTRSKSEAVIARRIYAHGLYFEYERKLRIKGCDGRWKNIFPDFTIWLDDGRIIYLEHAGKMHDEEYRERFITRLADYHAADFLVSRDLYITMDGPKGDIAIPVIDNLIRSF